MVENAAPDHLHILHIIPYFEPAWAYGGPVRVITELTKRLAERGHEVWVYTTDAKDTHHRAAAGRHTIGRVKVWRFRNLSNRLAWRRLFMPLGLRPQLQRWMTCFDMIHLHEYRSLLNVFALPELERTDIPYVLTPHGGLPAELGRSRIKRFYDVLYGRRLLAKASRLHALTGMERQQCLDMGLPEDRIVVIPNGIEVGIEPMAEAAAFRQRYDISKKCAIVGYLGRLSPIKGLDFLVDAFAEVLKQRPESMLALVGPDDGAKEALEARIEQLGIHAAVRLIGYIGESEAKAAAYRAFDVYVLPSRYENQPTTILESLLNAVPSILSDRCGLATQLVDADVARSVPFGDTHALAKEILDVLERPAKAREQAKRGKQYVTKHFDWEELTNRWIEVYRACVDEAAAR